VKKILNCYPVQAKGNEIERAYDIWVYVNGAQIGNGFPRKLLHRNARTHFTLAEYLHIDIKT